MFNSFFKESNLVKFALDINRKMKELGVTSLNVITDQDVTLDSNEFGIIRIFLKKEDESLQTTSTVSESSSTSPLPARTTHLPLRPLLSAPTIEMARNLHKLLLRIDNLPTVPPTVNPISIDAKLYVQMLLEKLTNTTKEDFETEIEKHSNENFLEIRSLKKEEEENEEIDFQSELNFPEIILETDLLKLNDDFDTTKENTIKVLVTHLIKVYDKFLEEHIETEIKRRRKFRACVNFLKIYRKIEIYCNLYKVRARGETIKNQANRKIIEYSSSKLTTQDISNIIKAGKRIERLISLSNNEWGIIDAFPNLEINFFKSTISTAAYEIWLKLVETGFMMSEEEGHIIYNNKKNEENQEREANFRRLYSTIETGDSDVGSPRYFPDE
jgi:hypothetical protein